MEKEEYMNENDCEKQQLVDEEGEDETANDNSLSSIWKDILLKATGFAAIVMLLSEVIRFGAHLCAHNGHRYEDSSLESDFNGDLSLMFEDFGNQVCGQVDPIAPSSDVDNMIGFDQFKTPEYRNYSLGVYSGAVKIPTEVFDDMGPTDEDPKWEVFGEFREYLKNTFKVVYDSATVSTVQDHGLLITVPGSDPSLKPILLMAHQDVVPVPEETIPRWTYPPYSGHFDGQYVWGRGSNDCKNTLIAVLEALETLLSEDYKPKRTIIASFGADEERGGPSTTKYLAQHIRDVYGDDSMLLIVDEGGKVEEVGDQLVAVPSTGEKGNIELSVKLNTKGGHASVPPDHTGIGIAAEFIAWVEANPYKPALTDKSPFFHTTQCIAKVDDNMDDKLRHDIFKMGESSCARNRVIDTLSQDLSQRYLMQTSQAVDIIRAGVKINALPEEVDILIDSRIGVESDSSEVKNHISQLAAAFAKEYKLRVEAFGETICDYSSDEEDASVLNIDARMEVLEPAPISPSDVNDPAWKILAGTIRHVFEDFADDSPEDPVTVAPGIMSGNTDTRYYWSLTRNIYRFNPFRGSKTFNEHSIDERVDLDSHIEGVAFYYELIRNANNADTE